MMTLAARLSVPAYLPAIVRAEFDSALDALLALTVPRDEAMDLLVASWLSGEPDCLLTTIDGGRAVVVLRSASGRWAACNAFLNHSCDSQADAERRLRRLLRGHQRGHVACLPATVVRLASAKTTAAG
ncbi:hypothetical protein [Accumulibacter sp.]|uniref:hypothetical protein n=1 Tax=Accumulibacter sp. TaxID=2053492 RepID=UPI0025F611C1|nr:hypothetical protein [Accumulibacter sp.]MCM8610626.1 hypothetical protein [Accumulibacter sp.]MCM8634536.1 hypothetical protein [Accumulibacter sp.]MCM8641789.1 hypothetical protein [Accumulibacter sp.]